MTENVRHDPQTLDEIRGIARVKSTGRVVSWLDSSPSCHHLSDGNPFSLTTADTTDKPVIDESGFGVGDIEHLNSSSDTLGRRSLDPGAFVERAKSRVFPTVNVIWISSAKQVSERFLLRDTSIEICAALVGDDLAYPNPGASSTRTTSLGTEHRGSWEEN